MDFSVKQGDLAPSYYATLNDQSGVDWTLAGAVVAFTLRHIGSGTVVVDAQSCTVVNPAAHLVRYDWQTDDTALAGAHLGEFTVTFSAKPETFPNTTSVLVLVTPTVASVVLVPSLCSVDDLISYIPDLSGVEAMFALNTVIPRVEREAEALLQHALLRTERTESNIPVYPDQIEVPLRYTPVVSITSVSMDGNVLPVGSYVLQRYGLILAYFGATAFSVDPTLSRAEVVYVGGLDPTIAEQVKHPLNSRVARVVMKYRDQALGTDHITAERYAVQYLSEGFTDDELKILTPNISQAGGLLQPNDVDETWSTTLPSDQEDWPSWS